MPIDESSSLADVCFTVCTALDEIGTTAVLSGGSAATFYAPQVYQSRDADFIITLHGDRASGASTMGHLGYAEKGGTYVHKTNRFTVEFPPGPLAIAEELITSWETFLRENERLHILTRTDCIRDRLLWYYIYADQSALAAAVGVARSGDVDMNVLRSWSSAQQNKDAFEHFRALVSGAP